MRLELLIICCAGFVLCLLLPADCTLTSSSDTIKLLCKLLTRSFHSLCLCCLLLGVLLRSCCLYRCLFLLQNFFGLSCCLWIYDCCSCCSFWFSLLAHSAWSTTRNSEEFSKCGANKGS